MALAPSSLAGRSPWRFALAQALRGDALAILAICALSRLASYRLMAAVDLHWWPRLELTVQVGGLGVALIGLALEALVWVLVAKIALEAFHGAGRKRPDGEAHIDIAPIPDGQALSHLLLWLSLTFALYLVALLLGTGWALLLLLVMSLALPAMIVLAAMEGGVGRALNPMAWLELGSRIGADYMPLAIAFAALALAMIAASALSAQWLPPLLAVVLNRGLLLLALCTAYGRLGLLLRERQLDLALDLEAPIRRPALGSAEEDAAMRDADALVLANQVAEAATGLEALIRRSGASAAVHERYRQLLESTGDVRALSRHAQSYIGTLLALGQERRALALFMAAKARETDFLPEDADAAVRLSAAAQQAGHGQAALDLSLGIVERFPRHEAAVASALVAARLLVERFGREDAARRVLEQARDRYPGHALQPELARALAALPGRDSAPGPDMVK